MSRVRRRTVSRPQARWTTPSASNRAANRPRVPWIASVANRQAASELRGLWTTSCARRPAAITPSALWTRVGSASVHARGTAGDRATPTRSMAISASKSAAGTVAETGFVANVVPKKFDAETMAGIVPTIAPGSGGGATRAETDGRTRTRYLAVPTLRGRWRRRSPRSARGHAAETATRTVTVLRRDVAGRRWRRQMARRGRTIFRR
mmetsp:Transcript_41095/g.113229  ORF Transcript_41095/g.113229 Transcript_41095/m.113229 type:complete len:207 (+) Transcript_41095:2518-3138(+)